MSMDGIAARCHRWNITSIVFSFDDKVIIIWLHFISFVCFLSVCLNNLFVNVI